MREIWVQIDGAKDGYLVSNTGHVRGLKGTVIKTDRAVGGYLRTFIQTKDGRQRRPLIHRLVAAAFVPNPGGKPEVNHINGDKTDNRAENLEWVTHAENMSHAARVGLMHKGKRGSRAKFTAEQIRYMRTCGKRQKELAEEFGVAQAHISQIMSGKTYKWVK